MIGRPDICRSVYMNGDVGKLPSGAVFASPPDHHPMSPAHTADYSLLNGVGGEGGGDGGGSTEAMAAAPPAGDLPALPTAPPPTTPPAMPLDQLKQMLSSQLEYYFSRENLAVDSYLISQMDNDQYVPIWTVANFNQVKKLTTDINLITEVLRESPNVQVDEEGQKVRPNHKRCIVILREIPDSTPLEEVKGLFSGSGCPKLVSCEFAHNNSWYVTFENDEDAQKAYRFLREEVKVFQGKPIMARIKAKPMNPRYPMPTVGGMVLKNGYRSGQGAGAHYGDTGPPPPPQPYPPAAPASQLRFPYPNGTTPLPPNYPNQVQIYTFQGQPFYPPSMLAASPWGTPAAAPGPTFFELSSVFSMNGLAPPQGTFQKHPQHNPRFMSRNNRSKRTPGLEARTSMSDSGLGRGWTRKESSKGYRDDERPAPPDEHPPDRPAPLPQHQPLPLKEPLPARRRRKEDEVATNAGGVGRSGGAFDLEATAFPPLPGPSPADEPPAPPPPPPPPPPIAPTPNQPFPENRLSDVVKGTAKGKNGSGGSSSNTEANSSSSLPPSSPSPSPTGSAPPDSRLQHSFPQDKMVVVSGSSSRGGGTGDRAKTDGEVNGDETDVNDSSPLQIQPPASPAPQVSPPTPPLVLPHQVESGGPRLSYAQVAQHHKDSRGEKTVLVTVAPTPIPAALPVSPPVVSAAAIAEPIEEPPQHYTPAAGAGAVASRGRGARGGPARRATLPARPRHRSPPPPTQPPHHTQK